MVSVFLSSISTILAFTSATAVSLSALVTLTFGPATDLWFLLQVPSVASIGLTFGVIRNHYSKHLLKKFPQKPRYKKIQKRIFRICFTASLVSLICSYITVLAVLLLYLGLIKNTFSSQALDMSWPLFWLFLSSILLTFEHLAAQWYYKHAKVFIVELLRFGSALFFLSVLFLVMGGKAGIVEFAFLYFLKALVQAASIFIAPRKFISIKLVKLRGSLKPGLNAWRMVLIGLNKNLPAIDRFILFPLGDGAVTIYVVMRLFIEANYYFLEKVLAIGIFVKIMNAPKTHNPLEILAPLKSSMYRPFVLQIMVTLTLLAGFEIMNNYRLVSLVDGEIANLLSKLINNDLLPAWLVASILPALMMSCAIFQHILLKLKRIDYFLASVTKLALLAVACRLALVPFLNTPILGMHLLYSANFVLVLFVFYLNFLNFKSARL